MNKRGWYDEMWNPITGTPIISSDKIKSRIKSHCCRFSGDVRYNLSHEDKYKLFSEGYYELDEPFKSYSTDKNFIMAPFGTNPTLHKYRFNTPSERYLTGRILFVNPFADTFLMPHEWLKQVFTICSENPNHTFVFTTDTPEEFCKFICENMILISENIWFGYEFNAETMNVIKMNYLKLNSGHLFLKLNKWTAKTVTLLEKFLNEYPEFAPKPEWILVDDKQVKKSNLSMKLIVIAAQFKLPIYFNTKREDLPHDLPKELTRHNVSEGRKNLRWGKCGRCRKEKPKNEMFRIGVTKGRNCSSTILGFLCDECYDKFKKQFEN